MPSAQPSSTPQTRLRVWDLPTRLFHALLALAVVGLVVTGNVGGNLMTWHFRLGYLVLSLLLFRLVWGFVGGHWSRFTTFVPTPARLWRYLRGQWPSHAGHNPLGALSVVAMLTVLAVQVSTGLISDDEIANTGPWVALVDGSWISAATSYHKGPGKLIVLALVGLHVAAIVFYQRVKKRRLVQAMVTGDQTVEAHPPLPEAADRGAHRLMALAVFALCAAATAWLVSLGG